MNGEQPPSETNKDVITVVVIGLVLNLTIGVASLSYCLITNREVNVALLTAFVGIVNFIAGAVAGMLMKTSPTKTFNTDNQSNPSPNTTVTSTTTSGPSFPSDTPQPVLVVNDPAKADESIPVVKPTSSDEPPTS